MFSYRTCLEGLKDIFTTMIAISIVIMFLAFMVGIFFKIVLWTIQ